MSLSTYGRRFVGTLQLWAHRQSTRFYRPSPWTSTLSWIGNERIAVGKMPTGDSLSTLARQGVTHVVNCRARPQTWISQDLTAARVTFGARRVVHAPMWDTRQIQPATLWANAAIFAATTLRDDQRAKVLIHCQHGRCRSVMVAYAVLRLRGHNAEDAADLILRGRREALLVPLYRASVEQWLTSTAQIAKDESATSRP